MFFILLIEMFDKVLGVRGGGPVFVIVFRCVGVGVGEVGGGGIFLFPTFRWGGQYHITCHVSLTYNMVEMYLCTSPG